MQICRSLTGGPSAALSRVIGYALAERSTLRAVPTTTPTGIGSAATTVAMRCRCELLVLLGLRLVAGSPPGRKARTGFPQTNTSTKQAVARVESIGAV